MARKAPAAATPARPAKRMGRPRGPTPMAPVTGVRIPPAVIARLDAITARRAAELAARGGSTSRSAIIVAALVEFCDREERLLAQASGAKTDA
jgi:hypothetical protein